MVERASTPNQGCFFTVLNHFIPRRGAGAAKNIDNKDLSASSAPLRENIPAKKNRLREAALQRRFLRYSKFHVQNPVRSSGLRLGGAVPLGLLDRAGTQGLGGYPHPLDRAVFILDADALKVRLERTLGCAGHVKTDPSFFLRQTLADNTASGNGFLSCNCTFSCHCKTLAIYS